MARVYVAVYRIIYIYIYIYIYISSVGASSLYCIVSWNRNFYLHITSFSVFVTVQHYRRLDVTKVETSEKKKKNRIKQNRIKANTSTFGWGSSIHRLQLCGGLRSPQMSVLDMVLNHLLMKLQSWGSGEYVVPLHCFKIQSSLDL